MRFGALVVSAALVGTSCAGLPAEEGAVSATAPASTAASVPSAPAEAPPPPPADVAPLTLGQLLAPSVEALSSVPARYDAQLEVSGVPDVGTLSLRIYGASHDGGAASQMQVDLSGLLPQAPSQSGPVPPEAVALLEHPVDVISVGDVMWVRWPGVATFLGRDLGWIEIDPSAVAELGDMEAGSLLGAQGAIRDPGAVLDAIAGVDSPVEELGPETVRGVETTRYRSAPIADLLDSLAGNELFDPEVLDLASDALGPLQLDLWIGADGVPRRLRLEFSVTDPGSDAQPVVVVGTIELFDVGVDLDIPPPPADQVTPLAELGLEPLMDAEA